MGRRSRRRLRRIVSRANWQSRHDLELEYQAYWFERAVRESPRRQREKLVRDVETTIRKLALNNRVLAQPYTLMNRDHISALLTQVLFET